MKDFFEVVAKCGHVGKRYYYRGEFYVTAENGKEAAAIVRQMPRVKHDHKYAILSVTKITAMEFRQGCIKYACEAYFNCTNQQEQALLWDEISPNVYPEEEPPAYLVKDRDEKRRKKPRREEPFRWQDYIEGVA